jgi:copper transport protein
MVSACLGAMASRRLASLGLFLVIACVVAFGGAPSAFAHARLIGTSPAEGSTVAVAPVQVIFKFGEPVGGTFGAVRVYNASGDEVDNLAVSHPEGRQHWMGVGLKPHLPDGTYTATYRVISADTHIVYGGMVFNIGHPGTAPAVTVAGLINRNKSGQATAVAVGVARFIEYVAIALMLGGVAFLLVAWLPGLAAAAGSEQPWRAASLAFARRFQLLLLAAVLLGLTASALGFLLQGASAAGVSLWASLKGPILENTLNSRYGRVVGAEALDWLLLGALLAAARAAKRAPIPVLRPVPLGADGLVLEPAPPRWALSLVGLGAVYLAITPALAGHASVQSPTWAFFPSDVLHVLAASVWVGGIACLLLALPAATRRLEPPARSSLLLATLQRFSPIALAAVIAIAATGVLQAYIDVRSVHALVHTTYGVLIIAKTVLLLALIGLGWINRERVLPALRRIVGVGAGPGGTGSLARRTMSRESLLMLCVFGVTAALISYAPPIDAASGSAAMSGQAMSGQAMSGQGSMTSQPKTTHQPLATKTTIGPAQLEMTVAPARVGPNTVHLDLINANTGSPFTQTKELTVTARLPAEGIGPLVLHSHLAGPGHYILSSVELVPGGTWQFELTDRVSEFQSYTKALSVPIE